MKWQKLILFSSSIITIVENKKYMKQKPPKYNNHRDDQFKLKNIYTILLIIIINMRIYQMKIKFIIKNIWKRK